MIVWNPDRRDTAGDVIGNACDAEISPPGGGDCMVGFGDLVTLKTAFFPDSACANGNPGAGFNADDHIDFNDLEFMKLEFFIDYTAGNPSAIPNLCVGS